MIKRFVIILNLYLLTIIIIGIVSCDYTTDCGPFPDKFKLTDITLSLKEAHISEQNPNGYNFKSITNDSVLYSKFTITILPQTKDYYSSNIGKPSFGMSNTAYACSPAPPTTDEIIENIEIICNKDFDSSHSAGDNLADVFDVFIRYYYYERMDLLEYLSQNPFATQFEFYLILKAPPEKTGEFEFTIKYSQDGIDFDYFEKTTSKILIIKE